MNAARLAVSQKDIATYHPISKFVDGVPKFIAESLKTASPEPPKPLDVQELGHDQTELPLVLEALDHEKSYPITALLDSGCTGSRASAPCPRS